MKRRFLHRSIKEAVDNLPSGICFFDKSGLLILCNRTMYRLVFAVTGQDVQTLLELEAALRELPEGTKAVRDGDTFLLPDGTAWRFALEEITDETGTPCTQVLASDVTGLYYGKKDLEQSIETLEKNRAYIRSMVKNSAALTRENEILTMKMRVHDELGSSLLKLRRYYLHTGGQSKAEFLAGWRKTVSMLQYKGGPEPEGDLMADLLRSAQAIGVQIIRTGELPENAAAARLLVRAVRECLTNAVRHAGAGCVFAAFSRRGDAACAVITNDGRPPEAEIVEGGGLSSLRGRVEGAGGVMTVQSLPEFSLSVTVPLEQLGIVG